MPTDSYRHSMMVERCKELALKRDLTIDQIMERTGLTDRNNVQHIVARTRKAAANG